MLSWFKVKDAADLGVALADRYARPATAVVPGRRPGLPPRESGKRLQELLSHADGAVRPMRMNFYRRASLANSFKWRLLEHGIDTRLAEEVTRALVLHVTARKSAAVRTPSPNAVRTRAEPGKLGQLLAEADARYAAGKYVEAIDLFREALTVEPRSAAALKGLGAASFKVGCYSDAEDSWRRAGRLNAKDAETHNYLGALAFLRGQLSKAESYLRRALKLRPTYVEARSNLASTLVMGGRLREADALFEKVLRVAPRHANAMLGLGKIAEIEGRFEAAQTRYERVLEIDAQDADACAGLINLRKMSAGDHALLKRTEELAAKRGIEPVHEATARFAIGKYCDDVGDYRPAFQAYRRANELLKTLASVYERDGHRQLVDDLIRVYTPSSRAAPGRGASESSRPVLVMGMMRSGTSLTEQILASHPGVAGAGELPFWRQAFGAHETAMRAAPLTETLRGKLATDYLATLAMASAGEARVIDKTPINADYLGIVHSVFPKARFIYMRRHPIDSCLSCYFQRLSPALNFTLDLADLAHYYREHHRLMSHWLSVLPRGTILEVPYEELIADQEGWTRRMLEFLDLEWDARCLSFEQTKRAVVTASFWQVRQRIYSSSVQRWRHYERFIGPLLELKDLG